MAEKKLRSSGKGRGWNFKKGQQDALTTSEAIERGSKGGKVATSKGFADPEVQNRAQVARKINQAFEGGNDKESTEKKAEA